MTPAFLLIPFAMQNTDNLFVSSASDLRCAAPNEDAAEEYFLIELRVPKAAHVGFRSHSTALARMLVQPVAVSSTVPTKRVAQLRANNTARSKEWRTTVTLETPQSASQAQARVVVRRQPERVGSEANR